MFVKEGLVAGPPHKRFKSAANAEQFDDEDDELLALAQSQLPATARAAASEVAPRHPPAKLGISIQQPPYNSTQEALDDAEEIAELVRLANSTVQPEPAAAQRDEQFESVTDAADRTAEASTSYSRASAPSWSGADIAGESMSVTLKDGRRAFCKLHDSRQGILAHNRRNQRKTLLSAPIGSLLHQVEQEAFATAVRASEVQQAHDLSFTKVATLTEPPQQALWVDKYSPQTFFELLSDEQVNREVIKWVKSWDACVKKSPANQGAAMTAQPQLGPEQKLLLLSGPPGAALLYMTEPDAGLRGCDACIDYSSYKSAKHRTDHSTYSPCCRSWQDHNCSRCCSALRLPAI